MIRLWVSHDGETSSYELEPGVSIQVGRGEGNEIRIRDGEISRAHCRFVYEKAKEIKLIDLSSTNGSFVNGVRIERAYLMPGDFIRVGNTSMVLTRSDSQVTTGFFTRSQEAAQRKSRRQALEQHAKFRLKQAGPKDSNTKHPSKEISHQVNHDCFEQIVSFCQGVSGELDFKRLLQLILETLVTSSKANRGLVVLYADNSSFEIERDFMFPGVQNNIQDWKALCNLSDRILAHNQIITYSTDTTDFRLGYCSHIVLPLCSSPPESRGEQDSRRDDSEQYRKVYGFIYLDRPQEPFPDDAVNPFLLKVLGSQAGIALQNAELYKQATTDPLTELLNRDSFFRLLDKNLSEVKEINEGLALIMIDLDHFKKVNDTYGHMVGDEVLARAAQTLKSQMRHSDFLGRYGGEEFIASIPKCDVGRAQSLAERMRGLVSDLQWSQPELKVTASFGIALYPEHGHSVDELIQRADQALYRAKSRGRNCVHVSQPEDSGYEASGEVLLGLFQGDALKDQQTVSLLLKLLHFLSSTYPVSVEQLTQVIDVIIESLDLERVMLFPQPELEKQFPIVRRHPSAVSGLEENHLAYDLVRQVFEDKAMLFPEFESDEAVEPLSLVALPLMLGSTIHGALYVEASRSLALSEFKFLENVCRLLALTCRGLSLPRVQSRHLKANERPSERREAPDTEVRVVRRRKLRRSSRFYTNPSE